MSWEVHDELESKDGVTHWTLFLLMKGKQGPSSKAVLFKQGHWFFGKDGGDPAGHRLYEQGLNAARAEVERLNRLLASASRE